MPDNRYPKFSALLGKVITKIEGGEIGSDHVRFYTDDGEIYKLYHEQDCCESVNISDIIGNIKYLLNSPIIEADESCSNDNPKSCGGYIADSFTWTFYRLGTSRGFVTIRWYGESNGYYSESVSFIRLNTH